MKLNLTAKFLLPLSAMIALFAAVVIIQIGQLIEEAAIGNAESFVVDFVQLQAREHIGDPTVFQRVDPKETDEAFVRLLNEISISDVVRIKVWANDGTIVFSDDTSIIGDNFANNENFQKAAGGTVAAEIKEPVAKENQSETGHSQLMEVYVPVTLSGQSEVTGVVETYYSMDRLNETIASAQRQILIIVVLASILLGIIIWLLLEVLVIRAVRRLRGAFGAVRESFEQRDK